MNIYPEFTQSLFLQLTRALTNSDDVYQNGCDLTAYMFTEYHEAACVEPVSREDVIREARFELFEPDIPAPLSWCHSVPRKLSGIFRQHD